MCGLRTIKSNIMKKSILNLGKTLSKETQKNIKGSGRIGASCIVVGSDPRCCTYNECGPTGGDWNPNAYGYGASNNCMCY